MLWRGARVGIVLNWRNEINKSELYPVHIRVKIGNRANYYTMPIPQKIQEEEWSGKEDAWVKPSHTYSYEINNIILKKKSLVHEYIKRCINFSKFITLEKKAYLPPFGLKKRNCSQQA